MTAPAPILVINPNSSESVTRGLSDALAEFRVPGGPAIECVTIAEGPPGVVTQRDVDEATLRVGNLIAARPDCGSYVIACYSQPGLDLGRSVTRKPVIGMHDAGVLAALALADSFGVIAVSALSIPRHLRLLRRLGVEQRLAAEVPLEGVSVADSGHGEESFAQLRQAGEALLAAGAGAVVLGCAGMSGHRRRLEQALGVTVIDPTQAAVATVLGLVLPRGR
jgi:Asp/Glu/hydantoin racemase